MSGAVGVGSVRALFLVAEARKSGRGRLRSRPAVEVPVVWGLLRTRGLAAQTAALSAANGVSGPISISARPRAAVVNSPDRGPFLGNRAVVGPSARRQQTRSGTATLNAVPWTASGTTGPNFQLAPSLAPEEVRREPDLCQLRTAAGVPLVRDSPQKTVSATQGAVPWIVRGRVGEASKVARQLAVVGSSRGTVRLRQRHHAEVPFVKEKVKMFEVAGQIAAL